MADNPNWVDPTKVDPTKNTKVIPDPNNPGKFIEVAMTPKKTYKNSTVGGEKSKKLPPNKGVVNIGEYKYSSKR